MSRRRFTTVHDFAALRVHPDGTRVPQNVNRGEKKSNRRIVQDRRGNWIARDAAGVLGVKRRRAAKKGGQDDDGELIGVAEKMAEGGSDKGKRKADELDEDGDPQEGDFGAALTRKEKRKRFLEDLSFLDIPNWNQNGTLLSGAGGRTASNRGSPEDGSSNYVPPNPSADLLKAIHYMASHYYHEMGQLEDVTRAIRKEKRRRARLKKEAQMKGGLEPRGRATTRGDSIDDSSSDESDKDGSNGDVDEDVDEETRQSGEQELRKETRKRGRQPIGKKSSGAPAEAKTLDDSDESVDEWKDKYADQDMYKIFDGSALMVMGMLLQEYVAELVMSGGDKI